MCGLAAQLLDLPFLLGTVGLQLFHLLAQLLCLLALSFAHLVALVRALARIVPGAVLFVSPFGKRFQRGGLLARTADGLVVG